MNKRERIKAIIAGEPADRCGFWMGNPHPDSWDGIHQYFGTKTEEELRVKLGDDCRWICPQFYPDNYQDPKGLALFDSGLDRTKHSAPPLAHCETIDEINAFPWPKAEYLNFDSCLHDLRNAGDVYRMSGFWTCFYHNMADLFGMEEYFIKMYTNPEVVQAATDKVCEFYYQANDKFFKAAGNLVDAYFFGNDFGTQLDLICGPDQFDEFIMPWFHRFTTQGHSFGYQVILHSCGAISKVIDRLIESGVDCLHPLQALAANMSAEDLAKNYKGRITFLGGVDTQHLLVHGTPDEIREDVRRLKRLLGPGLIISPSHEAILPNVPPENIAAMAEEAIAI
ncbi:MAG: uroporphyrinogen decarboxylase family protein [bacterium]